jgi:AAHS family benzoate transporter-like MFS transporter
VVAASFLLGALAIMALTLKLPLAALLATIALVGIGTSGTQMLIYGSVANYFPGVAWCAGFGRLGGVGGPLMGGLLIASGLSIDAIFFVLAGLALLGVVFTLLVPASTKVVTHGVATIH